MRAIGGMALLAAMAASTACSKPAAPAICSAPATIAQLKRIVFDQARQKFRGDAGPIDVLDRGLMATIDSVSTTASGDQRTDCQGRLRLEIPEALRDRFDGDRFMTSPITYSVQAGGTVSAAQGFFATLGRILGAAEAMRPGAAPPVVAAPIDPVPATPPVERAPATAGGSYYVTGLDPNGDNWLALKAAPDIRAARLAKLGPDTILLTDGERSGAWMKVRTTDGQEGWVAARYTACCR